MKKFIYLLMVIGLVFTTACEPLEDIYEELDAQENAVVGDAEYTLTGDDYDALDLSYGSFSSEDDAKTLLPDFLSEMYPVWGKESSVLVGYNLYIGNADGVSDYTNSDVYNLSIEDYALSGSNVKGFYPDVTPADYLADVLAANITSPEEGQVELVKYVQYTEVPTVISSKVYYEENFDNGSTAGDLTAMNSDWSVHSGSGAVGYDPSSLSMENYPTSNVGGSLTIGSGSEDVNSAFSPITSGKVYASTLVNLSAVGDGTYFFHFMNAEYGYSARVGAKSDGSGKILFGIGASSSSLAYGTTSFDLNTTYLLVSSYDIETGSANLHVLSSVTSTEPGTPETTNTGNAGLTVQRIGIRQGGGGPTASIDGIRVASSWTSIMSNDVIEDVVTGDKKYDKKFYTLDGGEWEEASDDIYLINAADFDSMGEGSGQPGKYNNFGSSTPPNDYLPNFLKLKFPYALEGEELMVIYDYYSSSSGAQLRGDLYTVTEGVWIGHKSTISTTLQFGHDGTNWVPDNTIKYTLTAADYVYMADELAGNADFDNVSLTNLANYSDYDYNWSDAQILYSLDLLLDHMNPTAMDDQKYLITYLLYDNGANDVTRKLIKANGEWVWNE